LDSIFQEIQKSQTQENLKDHEKLEMHLITAESDHAALVSLSEHMGTATEFNCKNCKNKGTKSVSSILSQLPDITNE